MQAQKREGNVIVKKIKYLNAIGILSLRLLNTFLIYFNIFYYMYTK